jgi:UPF0755 protein
VRALRWGAALSGIVIMLLALGAAGVWYEIYANRSHPSTRSRIVVDRGATFAQVARTLAESGIVDNVLTFRLLARLRGQEADVRAGEYEFSPHSTQNEVLRALVTGGAQVAAWVTIPEGFTAAQIAARLQAAGIGKAQDFESDFMQQRLVVDGTQTKNL